MDINLCRKVLAASTSRCTGRPQPTKRQQPKQKRKGARKQTAQTETTSTTSSKLLAHNNATTHYQGPTGPSLPCMIERVGECRRLWATHSLVRMPEQREVARRCAREMDTVEQTPTHTQPAMNTQRSHNNKEAGREWHATNVATATPTRNAPHNTTPPATQTMGNEEATLDENRSCRQFADQRNIHTRTRTHAHTTHAHTRTTHTHARAHTHAHTYRYTHRHTHRHTHTHTHRQSERENEEFGRLHNHGRWCRFANYAPPH